MMDKRMTSGEIAKKAGISQKAVRLYDEKGAICMVAGRTILQII